MKITWHAAAITPIIISYPQCLGDRERLDKILYTCTQHGFWIVSVEHVVLFCYGYMCFIYIYIRWHNREQWCISTKPCGLKLGSLDRRCFPEIHTMREEIVLENTTRCRCRWNVVRMVIEWEFFVQMKCWGNTNNVLLITVKDMFIQKYV